MEVHALGAATSKLSSADDSTPMLVSLTANKVGEDKGKSYHRKLNLCNEKK